MLLLSEKDDILNTETVHMSTYIDYVLEQTSTHFCAYVHFDLRALVCNK